MSQLLQCKSEGSCSGLALSFSNAGEAAAELKFLCYQVSLTSSSSFLLQTAELAICFDKS